MRAVLAAAIASVCASCTPPKPAATPDPVTGAIDPQTFADKVAGIRSTLARSSVTLDNDAPDKLIEICNADHSSCARCEVARREDTRDIDPSLLDGVALAFGAYPPKLLEASGLERVALCRHITDDNHTDVYPSGEAFPSEHRLFISIQYFTNDELTDAYSIEQVVHHEMFHLFDFATLGEATQGYRPWTALNPRGFAYVDPAPLRRERPRGFVDPYATTNDVEDRASTFEYLMGQPDRLCEIMASDPVVAAKTQAVWKRVAKVIGDKLLHQHAACVSFGKQRKPASVPVRRRGPVQLFPQRVK